MLAKLLGTREFTGWHMAGVMVLFFGTIISVNLTLAYFATSTWTGLVVKNSYVESQHFNERTAQRAGMAELGWKGTLVHEKGRIAFTLADRNGDPIHAEVTARIGRPTFEAEDRVVLMTALAAGSHEAEAELGAGLWQVDIDAMSSDGTPWKHSYRFTVKD